MKDLKSQMVIDVVADGFVAVVFVASSRWVEEEVVVVEYLLGLQDLEVIERFEGKFSFRSFDFWNLQMDDHDKDESRGDSRTSW